MWGAWYWRVYFVPDKSLHTVNAAAPVYAAPAGFILRNFGFSSQGLRFGPLPCVVARCSTHSLIRAGMYITQQCAKSCSTVGPSVGQHVCCKIGASKF